MGQAIGHEVGYEKAFNYAKESGCELLWAAWHQLQSGNATQACGDVCAPVCETALNTLCETIPKFMIGCGVAGGAAALVFMVYAGYKTYSNNQADPEYQALEQSSIQSYS